MKRNGLIVVLSAFILVILILMVGIVIHMSYMGLIRAEAQRTSDAAALAGAGAFRNEIGDLVKYEYRFEDERGAHDIATQFVSLQQCTGRSSVIVQPNIDNAPNGEVVVGRWMTSYLEPQSDRPNAVRVRLPLTNDHPNGSTPLFFWNKAFETTQTATATIEYASLLPFAVYEGKEATLDVGGDGDRYGMENGQVVNQSDGVGEIAIFPGKWVDEELPPGNFGAIDIGPVQGADVLMSQIDAGPTRSQMAFHGGALQSGDTIGGKTGVNASIQNAILGDDYFEGMLGKPRFIAVYSWVEGNGDNALFTLEHFRAVRIMAASLNGNNKHVTIQPITETNDLYNLRLVK